jgi:hypothetical protein
MDALALVNNMYRVDCIQCKNVAGSPGPADVREWWQSLGIQMKAENGYNVESITGSAGYSYAGLKACCFAWSPTWRDIS